MNNDEINRLMKKAQQKTGIDVNKMKAAADSGTLDEFVSKNLPGETAQRLKTVLSSREKAEKLLSTPEAKELLKKFTEGK